ncbi:MAG: hypothetical protein GWO04_46575, partial [Actinobacteria bacterium]|nr:hypothetical protein [Actinomycetota bacterium]NIV90812.1 hypothetical protein [Actinomycetota bacterium]
DGDPDLLAAASVADDIKWYVNRSLHRNASYPLSGDVSTTALGARSS